MNNSKISARNKNKKNTPLGSNLGKTKPSFAFTPDAILKNLTKDIVKRPKAAKRKLFKDMNKVEKKAMISNIFSNFMGSKLTG